MVLASPTTVVVFGGDDGGHEKSEQGYHWGSYRRDLWLKSPQSGSWSELYMPLESPSRSLPVAWPPAVALHSMSGTYGLTSEAIQHLDPRRGTTSKCKTYTGNGQPSSALRGLYPSQGTRGDVADDATFGRRAVSGSAAPSLDAPRLMFAFVFGGLARTDQAYSLSSQAATGQAIGPEIKPDGGS